MNDVLQQRIKNLEKSVQNMVNAKNDAQRKAAIKFMTGRAKELEAEQARMAQWLHDADQYIESNRPEINDDPSNGYNQEWLENLNDYQQVSKALQKAMDAYLNVEAA